MRYYHLLFLGILVGVNRSLESTTLVYNLRIRRVFTGLSALVKLDKDSIWAFSSVPIAYRRKGRISNERFETDVVDRRVGGGSIFNLRYIPSRTWWFEITTAVQKETVKATGTANFRASRTAFDDVVLSGGYNKFITKNTQVTLYGLAGFPTKRSVTGIDSEDPLVGTRFFALGGGAECSYSFINTPEKLLAGILQIRVIHFFKRRWEPIFPPGSFIEPGQGTDILLSIRYRHTLTVFETGYNPTIFTGQAAVLPDETIKTRTAVRHGTYANVLHLIKKSRLTDRPLAIGAGILFNRLARFDLNTVSAYLTFTLVF